MANTIQLKRSPQALKVPVPADLSPGEIAINTSDGRLYYQHTSGTVAEINAADARTVGGLQPGQLFRSDTGGSVNGSVSCQSLSVSSSVTTSSLTVYGTAMASSFSGGGSGITGLNADNLSSGTVPFARLPTGTTSSTVAVGNHTHATLYVALTGAQTISGLKTFSNGISDGFITISAAQINRTNGNVELQYNRSGTNEGVVVFGNTARASRFVASTGHLGVGTTSPAERLDVAGNIKASGFVRVGSYGINALPSAGSAGAGAIIYVPDAIGGSILAFSDGSNWRRSDSRSVIEAV